MQDGRRNDHCWKCWGNLTGGMERFSCFHGEIRSTSHQYLNKHGGVKEWLHTRKSNDSGWISPNFCTRTVSTAESLVRQRPHIFIATRCRDCVGAEIWTTRTGFVRPYPGNKHFLDFNYRIKLTTLSPHRSYHNVSTKMIISVKMANRVILSRYRNLDS